MNQNEKQTHECFEHSAIPFLAIAFPFHKHAPSLKAVFRGGSRAGKNFNGSLTINSRKLHSQVIIIKRFFVLKANINL